ncbi:helix-turn-helix transcriptional regulator [Streptomyces sp. HC44]|uniref:Helix-turn-helix transcriptional regulator n=1 Tax=Streptomyces scabichelini TaxID=2711217 RepID=A0A6G4VMS2_9ACTN|nr:helix-turn-helix transcriptional regulator [Streptomyces scabichelini]
MSYREFRAPTGLLPVVACLWRNDTLVDGTERVVPDGCVDLVWLGEGPPLVVGPDTGPVLWKPTGAPTCGVRLRQGAAGEVLGLPASAVRDLRVPLTEVWPETGALSERVTTAHDTAERLRLLAGAVLHRRATTPDPLATEAARRLAAREIRVADLAADLGVGERQLHRRVTAAVGYAPKTLARIARLRRLIGADGSATMSLADRALAAGYASQAHMTDEVRRLTGVTPVRFLEDVRLTAA